LQAKQRNQRRKTIVTNRVQRAAFLAAGLIILSPSATLADEISNADINLGRASILLERANDGISKLGNPKVKISERWTEKLQNEAADVCGLVQDELERAHLNDTDVALCSVE
jgi:hypothetical protein